MMNYCSFWWQTTYILQIMIDKSNIRFSYEQKHQNLMNDPLQNPTLEKLLREYDKQPQDQQQQQFLTKKSRMYPQEAVKNPQVFSDMYLQKVDKIQPKKESNIKYSIDHSSLIEQKKYNLQLANKALVAPQSLPQIRQSKELDQSLNESSFINDFKSVSKGKSFSINHYDIYKPGFLVSRQEILEVSRKLDQKDSLAESSVHQGLQQQRPHEPLNINFQSQTDHDMLQAKQSVQFSERHSQKFKQENENQIIEFKDLNKEDITVNNNFTVDHQEEAKARLPPKILKKHQARSIHHRAVSQFRRNHNQSRKEHSFMIKEIEQFQKSQRKQTVRSSRKSDILNPTTNGHINEQILLKQFDDHQKQQEQLVSSRHQNNSREKSVEANQKQENKNTDRSIKKDESTPASNRIYQFHIFCASDYSKVYDILKGIQTILKTPVLDIHSLLRHIKHYLEIVATGGLDHVEGYDMAPHRLKIIKNYLLYERVAVVMVSFAYAVGKIKECLKYLINLVSYTSSNTLLILKILESSQLTKQTDKNPIITKSDRLMLKRNYDSVRNSSDIILDAIFKIAKQDEAFHQSFKQIVKNVGRNSLQQTFYNVLQYFAFFLCVSNLHMTIPFLSVAPNPYLRETVDKRPTLIIDIVEVFCHGTRKSKSHIFRPHSQYFLSQMAQYYEIISFTSAYPNQIDKVIDILDHKGHIQHRLYRHHALSKHNKVYKDIERIGRDMRRMILLDSETNSNNEENNNTIMIPVWRGSKNDTFLAELCPILATIAVKNIDCHEAARKINQQHFKNESAGIKYLNYGINLE